jgi:hypothetical protein
VEIPDEADIRTSTSYAISQRGVFRPKIKFSPLAIYPFVASSEVSE